MVHCRITRTKTLKLHRNMTLVNNYNFYFLHMLPLQLHVHGYILLVYLFVLGFQFPSKQTLRRCLAMTNT